MSDPARSDAGLEREAATAQALAAMLAVGRNEIAMARIAQQRAPGGEADELATRILEQRTEDIDTLARLARERAIDLGALEADPLIRADQAVGRDTLDRLARAAGPELDGLYAALEAAGAMRLSRLADQAETLARDPEAMGSLRRIGARARDAEARAFTALPRECGGRRAVKPAAALPVIPASEERATAPWAGPPLFR
jgi:Domain of unknown function (DUF4142)